MRSSLMRLDVSVAADQRLDALSQFVGGRLADDEALGLPGEEDGNPRKQQADGDRGETVGFGDAGHVGREYADERDDEACHRRHVLEQHREERGILALHDRR